MTLVCHPSTHPSSRPSIFELSDFDQFFNFILFPVSSTHEGYKWVLRKKSRKMVSLKDHEGLTLEIFWHWSVGFPHGFLEPGNHGLRTGLLLQRHPPKLWSDSQPIEGLALQKFYSSIHCKWFMNNNSGNKCHLVLCQGKFFFFLSKLLLIQKRTTA